MYRRLLFIAPVIFATAAIVGHAFNPIWVVHAQSGATYVVQSYASYQTHTLNHPTGVAVYGGCGWPGLFIADSANNLIRRFDFSSNTLSTFAGTGTAGYVNGTANTAQFHAPTGIGNFSYVVWRDPNNQYRCFMQFTINDSLNYVVRGVGLGYIPGQYSFTNSVTTSAGNHSQGYVDGAASSAQFSTLAGPGNQNSTYFMLDSPNHAVRTLSNSTVATFAGNGTPGYVNGYRTAARFNYPTTATWDASGNMLVCDAGNHAIRRIDTAGNVTTFAGSGNAGFVDGTGTSARFNNPVGIVFNPADNYFYVTDTGNNSIRRISLSGVVTTYAGSTQGGLVNGTLSQARFQAPTGLAISGVYMYVADSMNNAIRRVDMGQGVVSTYIN